MHTSDAEWSELWKNSLLFLERVIKNSVQFLVDISHDKLL